jgi:hypothetical protein
MKMQQRMKNGNAEGEIQINHKWNYKRKQLTMGVLTHHNSRDCSSASRGT